MITKTFVTFKNYICIRYISSKKCGEEKEEKENCGEEKLWRRKGFAYSPEI